MICPMTLSKRKPQRCEELNARELCAWLVVTPSKDFMCAMEINAVGMMKDKELFKTASFNFKGNGDEDDRQA